MMSLRSNNRAVAERPQTLWKKLSGMLGQGNLAILLIALLVVFAGRSIVLFLAGRIADLDPGMATHQVMPVNMITEKPIDIQVTQKRLQPFELLDESNHIDVSAEDVIATENYWNLNWWTQYLLKQMIHIQSDLSIAQERTFWLYRDDGVKPQSGMREGDLIEEWLLCENQLNSRYDRTWSIKTAWHPQEGLAYFRLDASQYLHGELKADQAILDQAANASRVFISRLNSWLRNVTSEGARAPVVLLDSWPPQPSRFDMEGMICHVVYENPDGDGRFVVFYNVAIMEVVGFSGQLS